MISLIEEEKHKCPQNFQSFFVDIDLEEQDFFSKIEINRLIVWSSTLSYLDTNLTKIVDPLVSKEIDEYREILSHCDKYLNKITKFYSQQKRKSKYYIIKLSIIQIRLNIIKGLLFIMNQENILAQIMKAKQNKEEELITIILMKVAFGEEFFIIQKRLNMFIIILNLLFIKEKLRNIMMGLNLLENGIFNKI